MVLRKISLFGFKSFADKVVLDFGNGITAIVGPNGCGKSNVVDAIRWVFGEQKASALRSANMQDVIFSGTESRRPLNMAEVTLVIENSKKILPVEYSDVAITRRVYRSGESEYRLNNVPCRLKDIHDLFLDTGIGSNAYTTIENAMINNILSDKAEERRILFEEAAGVGKYKQRRKESQRKLEYTRNDLIHINDKIQDRERDVRMLARQVEKARRYRSWQEELKKLETAFEYRNYSSLKNICSQRDRELSELDSNHESLKAQISTHDARIEKGRVEAAQREEEVQRAAQVVAEADERIIEIDKDSSVSRENCRHLVENLDRYTRESQDCLRAIEEKTALCETIRKNISSCELQLQDHQEREISAREELAALDATIAELKNQVNSLAGQQIMFINAIGEKRTAMGNLQTELRGNLDLQDRTRREQEVLRARLEDVREKTDLHNHSLQSIEEACETYAKTRESLIDRIEHEDNRFQSFLEKEKQCGARIEATRSQLQFLQDLDSRFEGYEEGVKNLLQQDLPNCSGILAERLGELEEGLVESVEYLFGPLLQALIFEKETGVDGAVSFLGEQARGRAWMISLEKLRATPPPRINDVAGTVRLCDLFPADSDARFIAEHFLTNVFITDSAREAGRLAGSFAQNPQTVTFLSRDGVGYRSDAAVMAGTSTKQGVGILFRKQQIEKLPTEITRKEQELSRIISEKEQCIITRDEAKLALTEINEKLNSARREQQEHRTSIRHYEDEIESINEKIARYDAEAEQTTHRIKEFQLQIAEIEEKLNHLQKESAVLDTRLHEAKLLFQRKEETRRKNSDQYTSIQLQIQGEKHRLQQYHSDCEKLNGDIRENSARRQKCAEDHDRATASIQSLEARCKELDKRLTEEQSIREELREALTSKREEHAECVERLEQIRRQLRADQEKLESCAQHLYALKNEHVRDEEKMRTIRERIAEAYHIDLESPPDEVAAYTLDQDEAVIEENLSMYKQRIERLMGQVNMAAPEEYETKNTELKELVSQRDDLQKAVDDLEQAIRKLNREARRRFIETFEQVQAHFERMFTTLFTGGEARLYLEEGVDPLEAAIHINVRPAGKKMRGVQLLSGGERALTAISLLFALYLVKPSAYCILDELDAPLDEVNIERFVNVLREFARSTQFIMITHNKRTMEAADILYGVTQQELGVSTMVSVQFEEALAHAA